MAPAVTITSSKRRRRRFGAFIKNQKGATAVEFALVGAPFIALLMALFQTFVVFFAQELLESVVQQSGRLIMTGQVQAQQMTQSQFAQAVCSKVVILFNCSGLMIDVQVASSWGTANICSTAQAISGGQVGSTWQYNPGNAGDIVIVRVMYQWPVFIGPLGFTLANLSNGNRLLMSCAAFQNEPSS